MSQKNSREAKKRRRVLKELRNTPPGYINLIDYLKDRSGCTTGTAEKVLLAGALKVDSHPVGYKWEKVFGENRKVLDPYLPSEYRDRLVVVKPDYLKEDDE